MLLLLVLALVLRPRGKVLHRWRQVLVERRLSHPWRGRQVRALL